MYTFYSTNKYIIDSEHNYYVLVIDGYKFTSMLEVFCHILVTQSQQILYNSNMAMISFTSTPLAMLQQHMPPSSAPSSP